MKKQYLIPMFILLAGFTYMQSAKYFSGIRVGSKTSSTVGVIDSIATNNNRIKFYHAGILLSPVSADTASIYAIPIIPLIYSAAGDTSNYPVPGKVGNMFINTSTGKVYVSKSAVRNGWVIIN